jgi:hypothetical protein
MPKKPLYPLVVLKSSNAQSFSKNIAPVNGGLVRDQCFRGGDMSHVTGSKRTFDPI